jgi:hypothetical protein
MQYQQQQAQTASHALQQQQQQQRFPSPVQLQAQQALPANHIQLQQQRFPSPVQFQAQQSQSQQHVYPFQQQIFAIPGQFQSQQFYPLQQQQFAGSNQHVIYPIQQQKQFSNQPQGLDQQTFVANQELPKHSHEEVKKTIEIVQEKIDILKNDNPFDDLMPPPDDPVVDLPPLLGTDHKKNDSDSKSAPVKNVVNNDDGFDDFQEFKGFEEQKTEVSLNPKNAEDFDEFQEFQGFESANHYVQTFDLSSNAISHPSKSDGFDKPFSPKFIQLHQKELSIDADFEAGFQEYKGEAHQVDVDDSQNLSLQKLQPSQSISEVSSLEGNSKSFSDVIPRQIDRQSEEFDDFVAFDQGEKEKVAGNSEEVQVNLDASISITEETVPVAESKDYETREERDKWSIYELHRALSSDAPYQSKERFPKEISQVKAVEDMPIQRNNDISLKSQSLAEFDPFEHLESVHDDKVPELPPLVQAVNPILESEGKKTSDEPSFELKKVGDTPSEPNEDFEFADFQSHEFGSFEVPVPPIENETEVRQKSDSNTVLNNPFNLNAENSSFQDSNSQIIHQKDNDMHFEAADDNFGDFNAAEFEYPQVVTSSPSESQTSNLKSIASLSNSDKDPKVVEEFGNFESSSFASPVALQASPKPASSPMISPGSPANSALASPVNSRSPQRSPKPSPEFLRRRELIKNQPPVEPVVFDNDVSLVTMYPVQKTGDLEMGHTPFEHLVDEVDEDFPTDEFDFGEINILQEKIRKGSVVERPRSASSAIQRHIFVEEESDVLTFEKEKDYSANGLLQRTAELIEQERFHEAYQCSKQAKVLHRQKAIKNEFQNAISSAQEDPSALDAAMKFRDELKEIEKELVNMEVSQQWFLKRAKNNVTWAFMKGALERYAAQDSLLFVANYSESFFNLAFGNLERAIDIQRKARAFCRSVVGPLPGDLDGYRFIWKPVLENCIKNFNDCIGVLTFFAEHGKVDLDDSSLERLSVYFHGILEQYRVCCRITFSYQLFRKNQDPFKKILDDVQNVWDSLCGVLFKCPFDISSLDCDSNVFAEMLQLTPDDAYVKDIDCKYRCQFCLLPTSSSSVSPDNRKRSMIYRTPSLATSSLLLEDVLYHSTCCNIWINLASSKSSSSPLVCLEDYLNS